MAKLIVLAFAIATLLAFASAHRTIVTTTIEEDDTTNPRSQREQQQQQCGRHLQGQQLRQCQTHLQQPDQTQQQTLQQCCQELRNVDRQCQCRAVKKIFGEVAEQQQQQQETGRFGSQQIERMKQRAENLPNQCNLQSGRQCRIRSGGECRQEVQGRQFNRCQSYLERQTGSGYLQSC